MQLATVDMKKAEARRHFRSYRAAVRDHHRAEDRLLMRGYQQLALGRKVINVAEVISQAGPDAQGLPRLALCRADAKTCEVRCYPDGSVTYAMDGTGFWGRAQANRRRAFPTPLLPPFTGSSRQGTAILAVSPSDVDTHPATGTSNEPNPPVSHGYTEATNATERSPGRPSCWSPGSAPSPRSWRRRAPPSTSAPGPPVSARPSSAR